MKSRWIRPISAALAAVCLTIILNGCATARDDEQTGGSELPWNTPQPWEGSPMIPGFENR